MHACFGGTVMGVIGHKWCAAARGICLLVADRICMRVQRVQEESNQGRKHQESPSKGTGSTASGKHPPVWVLRRSLCLW